MIFFPFYISIKLKRKKENDKIQVNFLLFKGLIKFGYEIPFIDIINKKGKTSLEVQNKKEVGEGENDINKKKNIVSVEKLIDIIDEIYENKHIIISIHNYLYKKIEITKLNLETKIGLGDAALTAVSTGIVWSLKSTLISCILNLKKIKNINLEVVPAYNNTTLEIYLDCIIKLKIVYIIIAGINGLRAKLKGGEVHVRTSN